MSENPETVVEEFDYELPDEVVIEIDETLEDTADAPAAAPAVVAVPMDRPVQTVGRRKEAIVRIRLLPGTASSPSTAVRWTATSRTRCTSS